MSRLGGFLLHHLRLHGLELGANLDRARLGCLGHFANHIDRKRAIVEACARHLQRNNGEKSKRSMTISSVSNMDIGTFTIRKILVFEERSQIDTVHIYIW
jgi:hypothetical protein